MTWLEGTIKETGADVILVGTSARSSM